MRKGKDTRQTRKANDLEHAYGYTEDTEYVLYESTYNYNECPEYVLLESTYYTTLSLFFLFFASLRENKFRLL